MDTVDREIGDGKRRTGRALVALVAKWAEDEARHLFAATWPLGRSPYGSPPGATTTWAARVAASLGFERAGATEDRRTTADRWLVSRAQLGAMIDALRADETTWDLLVAECPALAEVEIPYPDAPGERDVIDIVIETWGKEPEGLFWRGGLPTNAHLALLAILAGWRSPSWQTKEQTCGEAVQKAKDAVRARYGGHGRDGKPGRPKKPDLKAR